jgi:hypothetical protein
MNAAEKLAREIYRVARLMRDYEEIGRAGAWALAEMNAAIERAFAAAGSNDALAVISAIKGLEDFTS